MKQIQMVDLRSQYIKTKPEIDSAIQRVVDTTSFVKGLEVTGFEKEFANYIGTKHVIACANGTDALQIAIMALDLKAGDEIITSPFTFIATAEVIALLGLKTVFVDVDPFTFNIDAEKIEAAITENTKAIVPVHLFGQASDMEKIMEIAQKYNLCVIEDAAQASGADYTFSDGTVKKAGCIGHIGTTSFFPSKNLGCFGDGGAIMTNDDALAEKMRSIGNHGMKVRYYHDHIGINSRLDTIQAAILRVKLKYLDEYNQQRRAAADFYDKTFNGNPKIITPARSKNSTHIFHQYTIQLVDTDRNELNSYLQKFEIPTMIYYPVPLHLQKVFSNCNYKAGDFPISEKLSKCVLSLPMHTELDNEQLNHICSTILQFVNK